VCGVTGTGEATAGFAVVDVETTGFLPEAERIVEVAVVELDPSGHEVGACCTLLDPGCDPGPTHVHGITAAMLDGAPTFGQLAPYLAGLLSGRVVVGHNVDRFDLAFLRAEFARTGHPDAMPAVLPTVDTLVLAQVHLGLYGKARLVDCCDHFGLTWVDHHSALGDARVTAALFGAMRDALGDEFLGIDRLLAAALRCPWSGPAAPAPDLRPRPEPVAG
jgi:DNA polymerase III epsilon subunit-like protein